MKRAKVEGRLPITSGGSLYRAYLQAEKDRKKVREKTGTWVLLVDGDTPGVARILDIRIPADHVSWMTVKVARERARNLVAAVIAAELGKSASNEDVAAVIAKIALPTTEHRKVVGLLRRMRKFL